MPDQVIRPRHDRLRAFVDWVAQHNVGDEKGHAQIFLDRLFLALGQKGLIDVGGDPEFRIRKAAEDSGGIAFAPEAHPNTYSIPSPLHFCDCLGSNRL